MLARRVSGGAICLGCRLRLFGQASRPNCQLSATRILIATTRTRSKTSTRCYASEPATRSSEPVIPEDSESFWAIDDPPPSKRIRSRGNHHDHRKQEEVAVGNTAYDEKSRQAKKGSKFRSKHVPLQKQHFDRNRVLTEGSASLGSDMLGKPAYAILMKERGKIKDTPPPVSDDLDHALPTPEPVDIQALLNSQSGPVTDSEVRANIDELRPEETVLSAKEFRRIQKELESCFLNMQLQNYIEAFQAQNESAAEEDSEKTESQSNVGFTWVKDITTWVPLATDSTGHARGPAQPLYGYLTASSSAKRRLALRIMRECWDLHSEKRVDDLGEVLVKMRNSEFILLLRGTRRFLQSLNYLHLEPGETIEAFRSQMTLRIVTKRAKVPTILSELNKTLLCIKTETFPLRFLQNRDQINDALLEEVGRITNTFVRLSHNKERLHVTWVDIPSYKVQQLQVENLMAVVQRFLFTALNPDRARRRLYAPEPKRGGRYMVDTHNKEKWGWKDKLGCWARYVVPLQPKTDIEDTIPASTTSEKMEKTHPDATGGSVASLRAIYGPFQELAMPVERPIRRGPEHGNIARDELPIVAPAESLDKMMIQTPTSKFPYHPVRWSPELTTSTTAVFGHILHSYNAEKDDLAPPLPSAILDHINRPHIFSPTVPHPMQLARLASSPDSTTLYPIVSMILIKLAPSPGSTPNAPDLELRLSLSLDDPPAVSGIHSLRAVTRKHIHDVLQPSSPVDIRFTQSRYSVLQGMSLHMESWQPIADFMSKAQLDLDAGKLDMPPQQRFPIPRRLFCANMDSDAAPLSKSSSLDEVSMNYSFTGLELHRSVSVPYDGQTLTYTSIEAGASGGRRAEVSLSPPQYEATSSSKEKDVELDGTIDDPWALHDSYMRACYRFARAPGLWAGYLGASDEGIGRALHHADGATTSRTRHCK
ncbi:mitochondrial inner-membrane-bound regulator-domain-containing protein [Pseudomassariella vexata]|uniref:Mitochondrial inner-membrane-bound regulator-domain-containing protein n=1 Tax=Pseudomassariella vexata TaxID=1141098 RepID=A0A1Y2D8S0_9PEZI|nr:mitochondrial inner-membrane-bound regulator-domain-containing protein [Pseudomassariella vexata]ORY55660.1 mitochondrial inner-membrane-bound regulator-domain-containing protein [Pseudomassariella vexata]